MKDVEEKEEVQELGRFAVAEVNRQVQPGGCRLVFRRVVAAEQQVVSGVKYFLHIEAGIGGGAGPTRWFDAIVVVEPGVGSRRLLQFRPASAEVQR
ncbi:cysteine proteinase inhibitor 4-like [Wolffia australiana]